MLAARRGSGVAESTGADGVAPSNKITGPLRGLGLLRGRLADGKER